MTLRLKTLLNGDRQITAALQQDGVRATGLIKRTPYSAAAPVLNPGKHVLTLTPSVITGEAPSAAGKATLTLGRSGSAKVTGKLGDGTPFSCAGALIGTAGGGCPFMLYNQLYNSPPGTVSGKIAFDPAARRIGGLVVVTKPDTSWSLPERRHGRVHGR